MALREKGLNGKEISDSVFVAPHVIKKSYQLASMTPALLYRLISKKLQSEASAIEIEGWKRIDVSPDLPYG